MKLIHPIYPSSIDVAYNRQDRLDEKNMVKKNANSIVLTISPLEPGLGQTLGNVFRRLLLRFTPGFAVTSAWIAGIKHELSPLKGVQEDLVNILSKFQSISVSMEHLGPGKIYLKKKGPAIVTTDDLVPSQGVRIHNLSTYLFSIQVEGSVFIVLNVESGKGSFENQSIRLSHYKKRFFEEHPSSHNATNLIEGVTLPVPHQFGPIVKASYEVRTFSHYDELVFEVETNGSQSALNSFESALSFFLQKFMQIRIDVASFAQQSYNIKE